MFMGEWLASKELAMALDGCCIRLSVGVRTCLLRQRRMDPTGWCKPAELGGRTCISLQAEDRKPIRLAHDDEGGLQFIHPIPSFPPQIGTLTTACLPRTSPLSLRAAWSWQPSSSQPARPSLPGVFRRVADDETSRLDVVLQVVWIG